MHVQRPASVGDHILELPVVDGVVGIEHQITHETTALALARHEGDVIQGVIGQATALDHSFFM